MIQWQYPKIFMHSTNLKVLIEAYRSILKIFKEYTGISKSILSVILVWVYKAVVCVLCAVDRRSVCPSCGERTAGECDW